MGTLQNPRESKDYFNLIIQNKPHYVPTENGFEDVPALSLKLLYLQQCLSVLFPCSQSLCELCK